MFGTRATITTTYHAVVKPLLGSQQFVTANSLADAADTDAVRQPVARRTVDDRTGAAVQLLSAGGATRRSAMEFTPVGSVWKMWLPYVTSAVDKNAGQLFLALLLPEVRLTRTILDITRYVGF